MILLFSTLRLQNKHLQLFLNQWNTQNLKTKIQNLLVHKMILIIHNRHHLLRKKRYEIMKDPIFLSSPIYPPSIPSKISLCTNRDDHLISILSTDDFVFKAQLTSLYMHPTDYSFRLYDKNQDFFTSIASKIMGPYQYWLENGVKIFSLQFNFFRPSKYDLKTDESDPSFLTIAQKATHHQTYTKFLQYTKPQNHIFCQLQIYITVHNDKYVHSRPLLYNRLPSKL